MSAPPARPPALRPPPPAIASFSCAGCGGSLEVRSHGSLAVACPYCGSVLDAQDPKHQLIAKYEAAKNIPPLIPIGARGRVRGEEYACLGFLRRQVRVEGIAYPWSEYLLFHPHRGYRWLSEYDGHWSWIRSCKGLPRPLGTTALYLGTAYRLFQAATAETTYALGEFPWQVTRGEKVESRDYVSPPHMISEEVTETETSWSIGEYIDGAEVWKGFGLAGSPPPKRGVGAIEPNPHAPIAPQMTSLLWIFLAVATVLEFLGLATARNEVALAESVRLSPPAAAGRVHVTKPFRLEGRLANARIEIDTNLDNHWADVSGALIDTDSREAIEFFRGLGWWHGVDGGESWSEGSRSRSVLLGSVPEGSYELVLEVETDAPSLDYTVRVVRDTRRFAFWILAVLLVLAPYLVFLARRRQFEYRRWLESDFPMTPMLGSGSGDDE